MSSPQGKTCLALEGLCWGYAPKLRLGPLSLKLRAGEHVAVLGPNGAGKTTLLRTLVGDLEPLAGKVEISGEALETLSPPQRARRVALLAQNPQLDLELTVRELVALGRTPHLGLWGREGRSDLEAVDRALTRCDLHALALRPLGALSGGERQRARLAMTLAQGAQLLLLDEPTTHLDLRRRHELFSLLSELGQQGLTLVSVLHEPAEAFREATRVLLLGADGGHEVAKDDPERRDLLAAAYAVPVERITL
ncbi:MAG: ABC transporter ATP-binding protein [Deltaproteobacteria bacterium]|nr:ABC transporter ATP-binding protein [Deltaproteobacteria bacterium]